MKTNHILTLLIALLTLAACDKQVEKEYIYTTPDLQWADALRQLDWGTGTAYAVGHKTPDADAVCSAVAYAALMRSLGFNCEARKAGETNRETNFLQKRLSIFIPPTLNTLTPDDRLIMTDHCEYIQSVAGADQAKLLQIIDHHPLGNVTSASPLFIRSAPLGATSTVVFTAYRDFGVAIPDTIAASLLAGILSDTSNRTKAFTPTDSIAFAQLTAQLHLDSAAVEDIYRGMVEASCSYDGMTPEEIYFSDDKEYEIASFHIGIGSLEYYDATTFDNFLTSILTAMRKIRADKSMHMIFCKVDLHFDPPYTPPTVVRREPVTYIIYDGDHSREIIETAYGPSTGAAWVNTGKKLSRKTDILPVITEALKKLAE
ncbi:MAG: DHH family phosphoesterase [Bacteroidaceae bacterium]|nr:DHH family phosphoesterase [Bacteroidaceae bacterium]